MAHRFETEFDEVTGKWNLLMSDKDGTFCLADIVSEHETFAEAERALVQAQYEQITAGRAETFAALVGG